VKQPRNGEKCWRGFQVKKLRRFRTARCPFNPAETCYRDRNQCATCDRRIRSGQRLLSEYAPKPLINERGIKFQTGQFNAWPNINEWATDSQGITVQVPSSGLCRECGRETSTGSQLFFICPVDGSWRSINDKCKFVESFEKAYKRKPTAEELRTYVQYIMAIRR